MLIIENIKNRRSFRTYTGEALRGEDTEAIRHYMAGLAQPLGGKARIELISAPMGTDSVKLGTYGVISGAGDFLVLVYQPGPLDEQNAGYLFEQVVLFCTGLGLGTCWLGGTFRKSDFRNWVNLQENEVFRIVSPVGYPAEKKRLLERMMRAGAGSDNRRPFGSLFFEGSFEKQLAEANAGQYREPLEMLRLAPSANNSQPWRAVLTDYNVHFYYQDKSGFSPIDLGIALCHFGETCRAMGIPGHFEVLGANDIPVNNENYYSVSWIAGN